MSGKRDHIIQIASELVYFKGFNNTSVDDVLQKSGVKKGNFYFYFKSKEELGFAVLECHLERLRRQFFLPAVESDNPPLEKLLRIFDGMEARLTETDFHGGCPFGNMALELSDIHEGFRAKLQAVFREMVDIFYQLLLEASAEFREEVDLHEVSQMLVAGLEGAIMLSKVNREIGPMRNCTKQLKGYLAALRCGSDRSAGGGVVDGGTLQ